jgi:dinuclear metal center YbgI/SA1388 family protein
LQTDSPAGKLYESLIKHDIAVYIAHTNLDVAAGGVNDLLATALGLADTVPLETSYTEKLKKLVVYVPQAQHESVREALFRAGAGYIRGLSQYSHCSFNLHGQGTFYPLDGANPHIGTVGRLETVDEVRVETVFSERLQNKIVQAMLKAHPYEEVAYDIYSLDNNGVKMGLGRVGKLSHEITLGALCERVKAAFALDSVRVCGDLQRAVRKIAVLGGSGARYIRHALFAGADVLITGDIDHHSAHDALAAGLCLIDAGHHIEQILKPAVAASLRGLLAEAGYATLVEPSAVSTNPFHTV